MSYKKCIDLSLEQKKIFVIELNTNECEKAIEMTSVILYIHISYFFLNFFNATYFILLAFFKYIFKLYIYAKTLLNLKTV